MSERTRKAQKRSHLLSVLIVILSIAIIALLSVLIAGISAVKRENRNTPDSSAAPVNAPVETQAVTEPPVFEVSLVAVGDNLIHDTLYKSGKREDGTRDYSSFYENVRSDVSAADIAVINQETILGGDVRELSGYPMFNSPQEIGDAAAAAGFDVFTCATNHSMDVYEKGIFAEIEFFKTKHPEVMYLGLNETEEEYNTIKYLDVNNIRFALLNYTYGTNGIPLPSDKPWIVNMLDRKEKITQDITTARANADVVIVFPHWGTEYRMTPDEEQKEYAKFFSDLGVDIIIGAHPHVIEPVEWYVNEETGKETLIYYSMGNFISHQHDPSSLLGGMVKLTIRKENGKISINNAKLVPLVTYYTSTGNGYRFTTYKLSDYTDELASTHSSHTKYGNNVSPAAMRALYEKTISENFRVD